jgi:ATP phosphoribosyltransferase regulatory subunit HisZ
MTYRRRRSRRPWIIGAVSVLVAAWPVVKSVAWVAEKAVAVVDARYVKRVVYENHLTADSLRRVIRDKQQQAVRQAVDSIERAHQKPGRVLQAGEPR